MVVTWGRKRLAELLKDSNSNGSRESNAADRRGKNGWKTGGGSYWACAMLKLVTEVRMRLWGPLSLI
jgi:hypothetical protein